ncbi:FAD binding domain-containing protein [Lipomyces doorenjongii]
MADDIQVKHDTPVLVVGAGPVGLLTAYELGRLGIRCILAEQSLTTTKWPKMDLTNCRSMEILRMWGLADEYRQQEGAVGEDYHFDCIFYTTMAPGGKFLGAWQMPSVAQWRESIAKQNDGTQPAEPGQRCSQIIFEAWMKRKCLEHPLIDARFGLKFQSLSEDENGVVSTFEDLDGQKQTIQSRFVVGCDGGASRVRKSSGVRMIGGAMPVTMFLVHFRSKELAEKRPFGRFWHAFPTDGAFMVDQDEQDTFTIQLPLADETDPTKVDPLHAIYSVLGGANAPYKVNVDEVLVSSAWRPNFCIADSYISKGGKVLLAGDAAHRNPPHGGYGMNSGVEDALAVCWRLSAILNGYGGEHLLQSYGEEQRPIMVRRLERSFRHVSEHFPRVQFETDNPCLLNADTEEGEKLRKRVTDYINMSGSDCTDRGIELDSRYESAVIFKDLDDSVQPPWDFKRYAPSTHPGSRAPHVFLKDGVTSIFDLYGKGWTLVQFTASEASDDNPFVEEAREIDMDLTTVVLVGEDHVHSIWERDLVLVRPDGHVAWRGNKMPSKEEVRGIIKVVTGQAIFPGYVPLSALTAGFREIAAAMEKTSTAADSRQSQAFQM